MVALTGGRRWYVMGGMDDRFPDDDEPEGHPHRRLVGWLVVLVAALLLGGAAVRAVHDNQRAEVDALAREIGGGGRW